MDLWINTTKADLIRVIERVDLLTLNDSEARLLVDEQNTVEAARKILDMGPEYVLVKKGEHGAVLFSADNVSIVPAYPLERVSDPTGAGDSFAGGLMGSLASAGDVGVDAIRRAMVSGTILASFGVEEFSLDRLQSLAADEIDARHKAFAAMLVAPADCA